MSKKGKVMELKKVEALVNMQVPITPQEIQVFNRMAPFYRCFIKKFASICHLSLSYPKSLKSLSGLKNAKMFRKRLKIGIYKPLF